MVNDDKVSSVRFLKRQDLGYKSQSRKKRWTLFPGSNKICYLSAGLVLKPIHKHLGVYVDDFQGMVLMIYWLTKFHKRQYK